MKSRVEMLEAKMRTELPVLERLLFSCVDLLKEVEERDLEQKEDGEK